jgi:hypothetical protein
MRSFSNLGIRFWGVLPQKQLILMRLPWGDGLVLPIFHPPFGNTSYEQTMLIYAGVWLVLAKVSGKYKR